MVISTFTNLIYLSLNSDNGMKLLEIDVMKDSYTLNKSGETIGNMVASDRHGTLYIESKTDGQRKFLALWDNDNSSGEREFHRQTVMEDGTDNILLGDREGKLYIGEIKGNQLVKIKQAEESSDHNPLEFTTFWEGQIPYDMDAQVLIGERGQVIMYNQKSAYIIENKQEKEVSLSGDENFISPDGLQLAEFTHQSGSIAVKLSPLDKDKNVVKNKQTGRKKGFVPTIGDKTLLLFRNHLLRRQFFQLVFQPVQSRLQLFDLLQDAVDLRLIGIIIPCADILLRRTGFCPQGREFGHSAAEHLFQSGAQIIGHHQFVVISQNDLFHFRNAAAFVRLQINRLNVEKCSFDGQDQQIAADDA